MAEDQSGERTQDATPKRRADSRKEGQVPRSKELNIAFMLLVAGTMLALSGHNLYSAMADVMEHSFSVSRDSFFSIPTIFKIFHHDVIIVLKAVAPFFAVMFVVAFATPLMLGGWIFSMSQAQPKLERISPIKGIKKIFSLNSIVELTKAVVKFLLLSLVVYIFIKNNEIKILTLYTLDIHNALAECASLLGQNYLYLCLALVLIAAVDVPYQLWQHSNRLKMTTQDVKDESKQSEVNQEVKGKIKQAQHRISQNRMIREVPNADVVITNPTHFAVALRYKVGKDQAPLLVAKGVELMAEQIKHIAKQHKVEIISAPPLSRAIYYSTELFHEVPSGLYKSVAKVLAYIYQLKRFRSGLAEKPEAPDELPIPLELYIEPKEDTE